MPVPLILFEHTISDCSDDTFGGRHHERPATHQRHTARGLGGAGWCRPPPRNRLLALTGADPAAMTGAALVDAIVASEKALSLLAGTQMRLLAALAVPFVAGDPMRLAAVLARKSCITGDDDPDQVAHYVPAAAASLASAEVAAALRIPCRTAGIRVAEADTMTGVLAPTLNALRTGIAGPGRRPG